ncbi:biotin transport system substrate-specific component [Microbacterium halimionae]|uniref:Biotin transporter n=1 Tax=Microbacterium halimionae TaxID=1526413 RepID=A0A7W3JRH5_9MICO|nr:biotin transporter BioY [Microbacterium halimionae]MBA8817657.1 biotin transport system substrate-specific component [Microbacterium halimionae]NII94764.1 biotin transport system substrate-specific component [Microbacterium halimionae]
MTTATFSPQHTRVLADLIPGARVRDVALVLSGTLSIALSGFIVIPLPFTPVPISLATFAVLLTGAALGPARGVSSASLYLLLGVAGAPIFGDGRSGWAFASFGYIIGYVVATLVVGTLARRKADRNVWATLGLAALGSLTIYAFGVPWLAVFLGVDFVTALAYGVIPFLIGDALKIAAMAALLPVTWRLLNRTGRS